MATTYSTADSDDVKFISGVMQYFHPVLHNEGVTLDILMARNATAPPVKYQGYPVQIKIKVNKLEDRTAGAADARLTIDAGYWESASKRERTAMIDRELMHLTLKVALDDDGRLATVRDDVGRPVFKFRKHDYQLGGFYDAIERHGAYSLEGQAATAFKARLEQMEFNWEAAEAVTEARGNETADEPELATA